MDIRLKELKKELRGLGIYPMEKESQACNLERIHAPRYVSYGDRRKGGRRYKFGIHCTDEDILNKAKEVVSRVIPEAVSWQGDWWGIYWVWTNPE